MILIIIFILCSFFCIPAYKFRDKAEAIMFWTIGVTGMLATVIFGVGCMITQSSSMTQKYQNQWSAKYTGLEQRIENWEDGDHTDATLWSDVQKYNDDLIDAKYWNNNIWVNWFNERACQEFETIDIPAYVIEEGK